MATAHELFEARHYPGVVALITDVLEEVDADPACVPLLLVRARAHMALRRDLDAQADLRDIIRFDPQCSLAYRLLGQLAARRDENESAAIFFREALRLDPGDSEAETWLAIVQCTARPAAPPPRFAKGTFPPDDDRPTARFTAVRPQDVEALPPPPTPRMAAGSSPALPYVGAKPAYAAGAYFIPRDPVEPTTEQRAAPPVRRPPAGQPRGLVPELPGFGDYLVATGILSRERLRAAQAYQRSMKVQLSTAIVTLGLATPQRIEWAAVAHQSQLARGG